jgi:hypothetical protein
MPRKGKSFADGLDKFSGMKSKTIVPLEKVLAAPRPAEMEAHEGHRIDHHNSGQREHVCSGKLNSSLRSSTGSGEFHRARCLSKPTEDIMDYLIAPDRCLFHRELRADRGRVVLGVSNLATRRRARHRSRS